MGGGGLECLPSYKVFHKGELVGHCASARVRYLDAAMHVQAGELRGRGNVFQPHVRDLDTAKHVQACELCLLGNVLLPRAGDLVTATQVQAAVLHELATHSSQVSCRSSVYACF